MRGKCKDIPKKKEKYGRKKIESESGGDENGEEEEESGNGVGGDEVVSKSLIREEKKLKVSPCRPGWVHSLSLPSRLSLILFNVCIYYI